MPAKTKIAKKPKKIFKKQKIQKAVFKKAVLAKKLKPKKLLSDLNQKSRKKTALKSNKKLKGIKTEKVQKKSSEKQNFIFSPEAVFKAKIKVVGIGGGGGSIVSEIGRYLEKATFLIADTDIRALNKRAGVKHFWFGEKLTHGLGTGVNVDLARQAAQEAKEKFKNIFEGQDIVIFIASLGGGLGSGATQVFVDAVKEFKGITLGIFTLPFKFEGKNKSKIALSALKLLKESLNISLIIPNEKIFKVIDVNTPITDAFSMVNKNLIGFLESLIDLIYNPGIINIDFADLKSILKGQGNQVFLNTIEESGKNRAEKICQNIFVNPLLQSSSFIAENILFNISGSESLSMFEVEKISSKISELNPKAKIIFGISKNPKLKAKIKTTLLATGPAKSIGVLRREAENLQEAKVKESYKKMKEASVAKQNKNKLNQKNKNNQQNSRQKVLENKFTPEIKEKVFMPVSFTDKKLDVIDKALLSGNSEGGTFAKHETIRRSGIEIKKAQDQEEKKRLDQEKEWEIPAFLRRIKYKS
jgi:cell division protein FtsZ